MHSIVELSQLSSTNDEKDRPDMRTNRTLEGRLSLTARSVSAPSQFESQIASKLSRPEKQASTELLKSCPDKSKACSLAPSESRTRDKLTKSDNGLLLRLKKFKSRNT